MGELTRETIDHMMQEELERLLGEGEQMRATAAKPLTHEQLESREYSYWSLEGDAREQLALNDYSQISWHVDNLLKERHIPDVVKGDATYGILCRELLKMTIKLYEIERRRMMGDYSDEFVTGVTAKRPLALQQPQQEQSRRSSQANDQSVKSPLLSSVIHEFAEECQKSGIWKPKTALEVMTSLNLLKEVLGDPSVAEITSSTMHHFKKVLMKLPPNVRKNPDFRDKSFEEILESDVPKTMSITTINKQLERASTLFKWAFRSGYMDRNPAEGIQLKSNKRIDEHRAVLTADDLTKIFHSPAYLRDTHKFGYRFWLPVIAIFSGMRLNEICQLHLADVYRNDEGIFVFDINARKGQTDTKTASSERIVPVHDVLLDLNLPGFVEKLRSEGQTRLFPDLKKGRDGYGSKASRWYAYYRMKCGVVDGRDGKKDFHSLRHTVANTLKQANAEHFPTQELLGHSTGSITFGRYGKRYSPKLLKEQVVDRLNYEIDLSHLKRSRFVVP